MRFRHLGHLSVILRAPVAEFGAASTLPAATKSSAPFTPPTATSAPEGDHAGATLDQGMLKSGCGNELSGAGQHHDASTEGLKHAGVDKGGSSSINGNVGAIKL